MLLADFGGLVWPTFVVFNTFCSISYACLVVTYRLSDRQSNNDPIGSDGDRKCIEYESPVVGTVGNPI